MSLPPTPEAIVPAIVDAWNARDAEAFAALFADDADFVNVVGLWWRTRDDIREAHAYGFDRIFSQSHMQAIETRVRKLSDAHAVAHLRWQLDGQLTPEGKPAGRRRGVFVLVCADTGSGWHIVAAQNTDRVPGSETHVVADGAIGTVSYRDKRD